MKWTAKLAIAACFFLSGCEASPYDGMASRWAYLQTNFNGQCVAIDYSPFDGECLTKTIQNPEEAVKALKEINEALAKARLQQMKDR